LEFSKIKGLYALLEEDWKAIERKDLADYWQLMNKAQLKKIAHHPLFTIGAHGWTHANLEGIDIEAAKAEILNSKKKLETMAGKTIDEFAFPFGFYTNELVAYAENIGFSKVLLVDYKTEEAACEEATRERFVMNPYISQRQQLLCLLRGAYY
jgi:peptidoglycan/xylan/chitin deacetylase (PgdA/CDA1 family)